MISNQTLKQIYEVAFFISAVIALGAVLVGVTLFAANIDMHQVHQMIGLENKANQKQQDANNDKSDTNPESYRP